MRIRYALVATLWLVGAALAQPTKLMLPSPVQVAGMVVDISGDPIPDVRIDYIDLTNAYALSARSGRFDFRAKGPAVIFRKPGWKSQLVHVSAVRSDLRVVLNRAANPTSLPSCPPKPRCIATGGIFCLPTLAGIRISKPGFDIDSRSRDFTIVGQSGHLASMTEGVGYVWGRPETSAVWDSVEFSEAPRDARGYIALDARGRTSDGKLWRSIDRPGESAFYYDQEQKDAKLFDRILDGLCVLIPDR